MFEHFSKKNSKNDFPYLVGLLQNSTLVEMENRERRGTHGCL